MAHPAQHNHPAWLDALGPADVRLRLHITALVTADGATGQQVGLPHDTSASEADTAVGAPWSSSARCYSLHASVLRSFSGYFQTRLRQPQGTGAAGDSGGPSSAPPVHSLLLECRGPAEVVAADAVLWWCYTGLFSSTSAGADGVQAPPSLAQLLTVMSVADRWEMPLCVESCAAVLAARCAAGDVPTLNALLSPDPATHTATAAFRRLVRTASHHLVELLRNVEEVCGEYTGEPPGGLGVKAQQLCLPAVLVLLRSDKLWTRSENSVLALAMIWLSGPVGCNCSPAEARRVLHSVRLGHLTTTFTYEVLDKLHWVTLSTREQRCLAHFAALGLGKERTTSGYTEQQQYLVEGGELAGPAAWYAAPREIWPENTPLVLSWNVHSAALEAHLRRVARDEDPDQDPLACPWCFCNGFNLRLALLMSDDDAVDGRWFLALAVELALGDLPAEVECGVLSSRGYRVSHDEVFCAGGCSVEVHELEEVEEESQMELSGWEAYLVNDQLSVVCHVHSCI